MRPPICQTVRLKINIIQVGLCEIWSHRGRGLRLIVDSTGDACSGSHGSWRKLECCWKGSLPGCISSHLRAQYFAGHRSEAPKSSIWWGGMSVCFIGGVDGWFEQWTYLCCDDVELELLPVFVGLFECLNLSQNQKKDNREQQMKS